MLCCRAIRAAAIKKQITAPIRIRDGKFCPGINNGRPHALMLTQITLPAEAVHNITGAAKFRPVRQFTDGRPGSGTFASKWSDGRGRSPDLPPASHDPGARALRAEMKRERSDHGTGRRSIAVGAGGLRLPLRLPTRAARAPPPPSSPAVTVTASAELATPMPALSHSLHSHGQLNRSLKEPFIGDDRWGRDTDAPLVMVS